MNFITKIFQDKIDSTVHSQFVRYSIGDYEPKAVVQIKNSSSTKITTGFEYVNDFLGIIGENSKEELEVNGKICLKKDCDGPFSLSKKKGYFTAEISQRLMPKELKDWINQYGGEGYFLFNIKGKDVELKTKTAPHNPKGKYNEAFCKVIVSGAMKDLFLKDIVFENGNFKNASIKHRFIISEIEIPKEYENDMALARIHAKRKGKIIRRLILDGKETTKEKEFTA